MAEKSVNWSKANFFRFRTNASADLYFRSPTGQCAPDFDRFDRYIEKHVGFTADSLYTDGASKKDRYQTVAVPEEE